MLQTKEIETLFRTYYRPLCLYALHYLGDPDVVEDVVQESFTALWRQENPVANVKAWVWAIIVFELLLVVVGVVVYFCAKAKFT